MSEFLCQTSSSHQQCPFQLAQITLLHRVSSNCWNGLAPEYLPHQPSPGENRHTISIPFMIFSEEDSHPCRYSRCSKNFISSVSTTPHVYRAGTVDSQTTSAPHLCYTAGFACVHQNGGLHRRSDGVLATSNAQFQAPSQTALTHLSLLECSRAISLLFCLSHSLRALSCSSRCRFRRSCSLSFSFALACFPKRRENVTQRGPTPKT